MERASVIGFFLVLFIFFIGLSNDIERFSNGTFGSALELAPHPRRCDSLKPATSGIREEESRWK